MIVDCPLQLKIIFGSFSHKSARTLTAAPRKRFGTIWLCIEGIITKIMRLFVMRPSQVRSSLMHICMGPLMPIAY